MNYDGHPGLRASEQDADDQFDDQADGQGADDAQDQTNDSDGQTDDAQDDQTDDQSDDQTSDDNADDDVGQQAQQRRGISQRAQQVRDGGIDPAELAGQTAAATARAVAQETAAAQRAAEEQRREEEAMAAMDDTQRATYLVAKDNRQIKHNQARTELLLRSSTDQSRFGRTLTQKPHLAKYEDEVERRHQAILNQGGFTDRQTILAHLIGERVLKGEGVQQQKQQARQRVQAQRGGAQRSARGDGGDGSQTRSRNQGSSLVSRMERDNPVI